MDNYITNDNNNPINWNGKEAIICTMCHNILSNQEIKINGDDPNPYCEECNEEEEERKELTKKLLKFPELERKYYTYDIKGDKVHIYQQNKEDENSFDSIEQIITQLKKEGHKEKDFVVLKKMENLQKEETPIIGSFDKDGNLI